MKNLLKFVFVALSLCFMFLLTSCEFGGTIVVKNNYSTDKDVTVYSGFTSVSGPLFKFENEYGPKTIFAHSSENFNVESNTTYGIVWYDGGDKYKTVKVSNGDTVEVSIP
jgi:hypothetical protein